MSRVAVVLDAEQACHQTVGPVAQGAHDERLASAVQDVHSINERKTVLRDRAQGLCPCGRVSLTASAGAGRGANYRATPSSGTVALPGHTTQCTWGQSPRDPCPY